MRTQPIFRGAESGGLFFNQAVRHELGLPGRTQRMREVEALLFGLIANAVEVAITWQRTREGEANLLAPVFERLRALHRLAWPDQLDDADLVAHLAHGARAEYTDLPPAPLTRPPAPSVPANRVPATISASAYNTLMACPYQFFARHVLKLQELDEVQEELDKADYGSRIHAVLNRFHREHPRLLDIETKAAEAALDTLSQAEFRELIAADYVARAWLARWQWIPDAIRACRASSTSSAIFATRNWKKLQTKVLSIRVATPCASSPCTVQRAIVWLLDAGAPRVANRGYDVLIDWPPGNDAPASFSLRNRASEMSRMQGAQAERERSHDEREDANLLYVAMTRARQALIVSGCEGLGVGRSWYQRVRAAVAAARAENDSAPEAALSYGVSLARCESAAIAPRDDRPVPGMGPASLPPAVLPTGCRRGFVVTAGHRFGTLFHRVMEWLSSSSPVDVPTIASRLGLTQDEAKQYADQARRLMQLPKLRRYFDPDQYRRAFNELSLALSNGEVRRLDRVVEFDTETWVLDYKTGRHEEIRGTSLEAEYQPQVASYCAALRQVFGGKTVRGALLFSDGETAEVKPTSTEHAGFESR